MTNTKSRTLHFSVQTQDTISHTYSIRCTFIPESNSTKLIFPSWTPGSYMIRDYSRHLHGFHANVDWEQTGLSEWTLQTVPGQEAIIEYKIYAFEDLSVRTNHLDEDFGFINPSGLFLYPEELLESDMDILVKFPDSPFPYIYTSLESISSSVEDSIPNSAWDSIPNPTENSITNPEDVSISHCEEESYPEKEFIAHGIDELYDSPFLLSFSESKRFLVGEHSHEIVVEGNVSEDWLNQLCNDLTCIIVCEITMMGDNPNSHYLFMLLLSSGGYGGLEHSSSSVNIFDSSKIHDEKEYRKLLELLAHEYFHLWNVKRIRPIALGPFDYTTPNLTRELWIAEGITSFYDAYFLLRSKIMNPTQYLEKLMEDILILEDNSGEEIMSLEESSWTAWNKLYKRTANSNNTAISYYTKGGILTLCMNLRILQTTQGRKDFSQIMRELYENFYKKLNRGFTKEEFFATAKSASEVDLKSEFNPYITESIRIPVYDYLKIIGIKKFEEKPIADPGFQCRESPGSITVNKIYREKIDPIANLYLGDEILGVNYTRIKNLGEWKSELKLANPGDTWSLQFSRKGELRSEEIVLGKSYEERSLILEDDVDEETGRLRECFFQ